MLSIKKQSDVTLEIPTIDDIISFDKKGRVKRVDWSRIVELWHLSNMNDNKMCIKAYRNLGECISTLADCGVLSRYKTGCYSVLVYRHNDHLRERLDPVYDGDFYAFKKGEDAELYLNNIKHSGKIYIHQW